MSVKKVALIFGTRPEAIKLAPLYMELSKHKEHIQPLLWLTGQHKEMLSQVMRTFNLLPDRDFALMKENQSLTRVSTEVLTKLETAFCEERPELVVVQGDTTSSTAAALAAFYQKIPVAHVEAGLRTEDKYSPYPEEMNRRLTTRLADYHFAPTEFAKNNLRQEGISEECIWLTGNTVVDALEYVVKLVRETRPKLPETFPLKEVEAEQKMVLITGHRRENFGSRFESLCRAILSLSEKYPEVLFVYPVHLNPKVQEPVFGILEGRENIFLTAPLDYTAFVWAMDRSHFLLSDSGGIQEEAPHLGKPVLIMRDSTERPEALQAGTAKLVGTDFDTILREASLLLEDENEYARMSTASNPFGDGYAARRITETLLQVLPSRNE